MSFLFIREMITRSANERARETKRNETNRRAGECERGVGGGVKEGREGRRGEGKERKGEERKGNETKRKKERSERVTERCFNLHNDRSVPFRSECASHGYRHKETE